MTKTKIVLGAVALLVVGFVLGVLGAKQEKVEVALGNAVEYGPSYFVGDVYNGQSGTKVLSGGEVVGPIDTGSNTVTIGSSGTAISGYKCATASWNPGAVTPTSTAETSVTVSGAALGDIALASISLSQQSLDLTAFATTTDTIYVRLSQPDTDLVTAVDIATTTLEACYLK